MKKKIRKQLLYLALIVGMLIFSCVCQVYASSKISLKNAKIKLSAEKLVYNKKVQHPKITVISNGKRLKEKNDYTVKFSSGCKKVGTYTVRVSGKGKYTGTVKKQFQIIPPATTFSYLMTTKQSDNYILQAVWKKQTTQTSGYEVCYSTSSKMKNSKKIIIKKKSSNYTYIQNLKPETTYYLQIRTYGVVKNKKYYSKWSSVWSCKTIKRSSNSNSIDTPIPTKTPVPTPTLTPEPTQIPKLKIKSGKETVNIEVSTRFSIQTTNEIKSVEISDPTVIYQKGRIDGDYSFFETLEPGKAVITFTDIYGQKATSTIMVTEKTQLHNAGSVETISTVVDNTLPRIVIHSASCSKYYMFASYSVENPDETDYEGVEGYLSCNFVNEDHILIKHNGQGNGIMPFIGMDDGIRCYIKMRSYAVRGNVKVVGPWSEIVQKDKLCKLNPSNEKANYTYEVYGIDRYQSDFYAGTTKPIYIKTDNPDADGIDIMLNGESMLINMQDENGCHIYKDVAYEGDEYEDSALVKVKGGYLTHICFKNPGTYTVEIREYGLYGYTTAKNITFNVYDRTLEMKKWMQDVIDKNTTSDMSPFEKMDAIETYLKTPGLFKYSTVYEGKVIQLAANVDTPFWVEHRWDSASSPQALCEFANLIGGFDEIHNCYWDYYIGTEEWHKWHAYARLTIGQEVRYYVVCPSFSTGIIDQIDMIDFSDVSNFREFS